jgi:hypothetical protein
MEIGIRVNYLNQPAAGQTKATSENPVPLDQCTQTTVERRHINRPRHLVRSANVKRRTTVVQLAENPVAFLCK